MTAHTENDNPFGGVIFSYTRAQAIEDGVLVDVSAQAREHGLKFPVAVTSGVWSGVVEPPPIAAQRHETALGRLHDILNMMMLAIRMHRGSLDTIHFRMIATDHRGRRSTRKLWAKCGPGDAAEPVITIMLEGED